MILAGLIVVVVFVLSARRKPNKSEMDMSAIARSIEIHMPNAPQAVRMRMLKVMLEEAEQAAIDEALPRLRTIEAARASRPTQPGVLKRGWQALRGTRNEGQDAALVGEEDERKSEELGESHAAPLPAPGNAKPATSAPPEETLPPHATDNLSAFAQALKASTGLDLAMLIRQALDKSSEQPVETGAQALPEEPPFPAIRGALPGANHHQQERDGIYERWGGEGEGSDEGTSFRQRAN